MIFLRYYFYFQVLCLNQKCKVLKQTFLCIFNNQISQAKERRTRRILGEKTDEKIERERERVLSLTKISRAHLTFT